MTGRVLFGKSYPTRCFSCDVPIRNADAVENPDKTGSDKKVAIAPTPNMRITMCHTPTHKVNVMVTATWVLHKHSNRQSLVEAAHHGRLSELWVHERSRQNHEMSLMNFRLLCPEEVQ